MGSALIFLTHKIANKEISDCECVQ